MGPQVAQNILISKKSISPQCLKTKYCRDVHSSLSSLLEALNKPDAPYALSLANRLYGEKSYQFIEVCVIQTIPNSVFIISALKNSNYLCFV